MTSQEGYREAIDEVKGWLAHKNLDRCLYLLVDNGYDDLSALAQCSAEEEEEFTNIFPKPEQKKEVSVLLDCLRQVGIDAYRKQKSSFQRLLDGVGSESQEKRAAQAAEVAKQREALQTKPNDASSASSTAPASSSSESIAQPLPPPGGADDAEEEDNAPAPPPAAATGSAASATEATKQQPSSASSSAAAATADDPSNPTLAYDITTWDGAIQFHSYVQAKWAMDQVLADPSASPSAVQPFESLEKHFLAGRVRSLQIATLSRRLSQLRFGAFFKKFKHATSQKRWIFLTPNLDYLCWSENESKVEIKGFMDVSTIQEVHADAGFSKKNSNKIYVVAPERTLELEAANQLHAKEWKENIETLIQYNMAELEHKSKLISQPTLQDRLKSVKSEVSKLVCNGGVFRKWPNPGTSKLGSFTTRLIWAPNPTAAMNSYPDRIQWGDIVNRKVMGFVLMQDIVMIQEDPNEAAKFCVYTLKRTLPLEARNDATRDKWVRAFRFFVEFKRKEI